MRHGLVDEDRLTIHPVIIGTGKRLFADGAIPTALEPVSVTTTKGGTVVGVYRANGEPSYPPRPAPGGTPPPGAQRLTPSRRVP
jgi:hypothetical protein